MNKMARKHSISSSQNKGLSPSCIALSFNVFGAMPWHIIWFFGSYTVFTLFFGFSAFSAGIPLKRLK
jgi:hypothetical protein